MRYIEKLLAISLGCYAISLLLSIALMEIFSSLIALLVIGLVIKERQWQLFKFRWHIEGALFGLLGVVILGAIVNNTESPPLKIIGGARWTLLFILVCAALRAVPVERWEKFAPLLLGVIGVISIYAIFQHFTGVDLFRPGRTAQLYGYNEMGKPFYRTGGPYGTPMTYGNTIGIVFFFCLAQLFAPRSRTKKYLVLAALLCLTVLASLVLTFTRGVWVGLTAGLIAFFLMFGIKKFAKFALIICAAFAVIFKLLPSVLARVQTIFDPTYGSNVERWEIWKSHLAMFQEHPWLGVGYRESGHAIGDFLKSIGRPEVFAGHAHNNVLEVLGGTGVLGFCFWSVFILSLFVISWKLFQNQERPFFRILALAGIAGHMFMQASGLTETTFFDAETNHTFLFLMACMLVSYERSSERSDGAARNQRL